MEQWDEREKRMRDERERVVLIAHFSELPVEVLQRIQCYAVALLEVRLALYRRIPAITYDSDNPRCCETAEFLILWKSGRFHRLCLAGYFILGPDLYGRVVLRSNEERYVWIGIAGRLLTVDHGGFYLSGEYNYLDFALHPSSTMVTMLPVREDPVPFVFLMIDGPLIDTDKLFDHYLPE